MTFTKFTDPAVILETMNNGKLGRAPGMPTKPTIVSTPKPPLSNMNKNISGPMPKTSTSGNAMSPQKTAPSATLVGNKKFNESYSKYQSNRFKQIVNEYMDIYDYSTSKRLAVLDEAEQNSLLLSLTDKLYKMIIGKIDDIEFGEIPRTRGDITRLSKYNQIVECIDVLRGIFKQYKEDPEPVNVIDNALSNIINHKDVFMASYASKVKLGMIMYNTMCLSVVNGLSYMIAVCIEYIKDPKHDGMKIVLDKTAISKVKDHLVYENLVKFNDACREGDIDNSLQPLIKAKAKGFAVALLGLKTLLILGGVLIAVIPMIRDLVYFFFATRSRISTYFDIQADLLEMNAHELQNDPDIKTEADKKEVIRRQLAIASGFHKIADLIAVEAKASEREATNNIKQDTRKYKVDEVDTDYGTSSTPQSGDSLF